jgi:hypothetical protein
VRILSQRSVPYCGKYLDVERFYFKWFLTIVIFFVSSLVHAQFSVVATAGTTGPTSYTTLKNGFDAINAGTHTGAIIITVNGNSTETVSATLNKSGAGASSYTSVLIKPATGTNPIISGTMANPVIILDGAMNVTIDGSNTAGGTTKNMTISNSNTSASANAIILINGASNNVIKNSVIQSAVTNSATLVLSTSTNPAGNNNNTIENNDITKSPGGMPSYGILNIGTSGKPNSGNIYKNNRIFEFSHFGFADGDDTGDIGFSNNTLVEGNEFYNTASQSNPLVAVFIRNETGISNMTISKNKIHSLTTTSIELFGILLYDAVSVTVVNNMISLSNSPSDVIGIGQETGAGAVIKIYNNTVYITGTTSNTNSFALFKNWFSTGDDFRNNILINTRVNNSGAKGQYAIVQIEPGSFTSNYNDLVSVGNANNYVGHINTGSNPIYYTTLAQWQAGASQDANSISIMPVFVSAATDLHLNPANNCRIDDKGTPIAGITSDIDGNTRSTTIPDIGADEFTSITTPTTITTQPLSVNTCLQQSATFTVVASGAGILTYQWKKDAIKIPGANTATYTVSNIIAGDAGNYSVVVTGSCDSVTSTNATLTVSGPCTSVQVVDAGIESIILKPNPVYNATTLCVHARRIMKITWRIVDMNGRVVMVLNRQVYAGQNDIQLKLDGLGAGTYYIIGQTSKGRTQVVRLIKL